MTPQGLARYSNTTQPFRSGHARHSQFHRAVKVARPWPRLSRPIQHLLMSCNKGKLLWTSLTAFCMQPPPPCPLASCCAQHEAHSCLPRAEEAESTAAASGRQTCATDCAGSFAPPLLSNKLEPNLSTWATCVQEDYSFNKREEAVRVLFFLLLWAASGALYILTLMSGYVFWLSKAPLLQCLQFTSTLCCLSMPI